MAEKTGESPEGLAGDGMDPKKDGWKFEIDDSKAKLTDKVGVDPTGSVGTLGEFWTIRPLFKAYPECRIC